MTKMTNAAAALLSSEPDMNGECPPGRYVPESRSPRSFQAAGASNRAAARVILVILSILPILSPAVPTANEKRPAIGAELARQGSSM
ncbi:MAG: hypothetical protein K0S86_3813, partial [Geminicoccaceae bacterium]|nr:hypothetical protein [Geminicoccaceae bacterium]